jgi:hypothetical protein
MYQHLELLAAAPFFLFFKNKKTLLNFMKVGGHNQIIKLSRQMKPAFNNTALPT